jgi:hypothetical protein
LIGLRAERQICLFEFINVKIFLLNINTSNII